MVIHRLVRYSLLFLLVAAGACDGFLTPRPQASFSIADGDLTLVRVAPDAPSLDSTEVSFWIVRGEEREVQISYVDADGYVGKCMRFVVPAEAPLRHANGEVFAPGDSALVTVRVIDPELFLFEFDPAGMMFNPAYPARLEVRYRWLAEDTNGDGIVDGDDEALANSFTVWRQEAAGQAWTNVPSQRLVEIEEMHADISGFTRYALASD